MSHLSRWLVLALAVLAFLVVLAPVSACPFCGAQQGLTLVKEVDQASMVIYGTLKNGREGPNFKDGTTDLQIEHVFKEDKALGGKAVLTLNRYIEPDARYKFLVFCDVFNGKIDPYQGRPLSAKSDIVDYLKGAMELKGKDQASRLKFCFNYLDNKDGEISNDAYKEFALADYKDLVPVYKDLDADKIAGWVANRDKTPPFRLGLYGSMLGHCGKEKHADIIRNILDDTDNPPLSGVDGMLAGYVMLKPKEGYEYLCKILKDGEQDWAMRYAALRAARFFWEYRPDVLDKEKIAHAASLMLDQGDICDLAIEDLRKWSRWETAERIFALTDKPSHQTPIVQRAIIRYALSASPKSDKAGQVLAHLRVKNAKMVDEAAALLKAENIK